MSRMILGLCALLVSLAPVLAAAAPTVRVLAGLGPQTDAPRATREARWVHATRYAARELTAWAAARGAVSPDPRPLWIANAVALTVPAAAVAELARHPLVASVELDEPAYLEAVRRVPRATDDTPEWTYGLIRLRVPEVRRAFGLTGKGVRVGLIDSGVDASHPDLAGKVERFQDLVSGRVDPYDDNGHGTHCAGTIAGGSASGPAIGVAPGARLLVVKAFTAGGATTKEQLLAAMQWMADPDGDPATADQPALCSNSWHGSGGRKFYLEATRRWVALGILPVFAEGNDGPGPSTTWIPAGYLESFAVGATDARDRIAEFSSHGPIFWDGIAQVKPDVVAPGEEVTSAQPGGGLVAMSGTSMATPHVAGALALILEAHPGLALDRARALLERTTVELGDPGKDNVYGAGRIDLYEAVRQLARAAH